MSTLGKLTFWTGYLQVSLQVSCGLWFIIYEKCFFHAYLRAQTACADPGWGFRGCTECFCSGSVFFLRICCRDSPGYQQPFPASSQRLPNSPRPLLLPHLILGSCSRGCFAVIPISDAHKCPMGFISSSWDALPHQHCCLSTSKAGQELFITFKASQQETLSRLNILSCRTIRKIFSAHRIVQLEVLTHVREVQYHLIHPAWAISCLFCFSIK